jgi:hypothetical protein
MDALRAEPPCVKTKSVFKLATNHLYAYIKVKPTKPDQGSPQKDDRDVVSLLMTLLSMLLPLAQDESVG